MLDFVSGFPYLYISAGSFIAHVCVCVHTSVYICISWPIYMATISGRIPLTSETSNSFCAQTCKLVLCHLRVLHSKWQLQHVLSPSLYCFLFLLQSTYIRVPAWIMYVMPDQWGLCQNLHNACRNQFLKRVIDWRHINDAYAPPRSLSLSLSEFLHYVPWIAWAIFMGIL